MNLKAKQLGRKILLFSAVAAMSACLAFGAVACGGSENGGVQNPSEEAGQAAGSVLVIAQGEPAGDFGEDGDICLVSATGALWRKTGTWAPVEYTGYEVQGNNIKITYTDGTVRTYAIAAPAAAEHEHAYGDVHVIYEAYCVVPGIGVHTCTVSDCDVSEVVIIPAEPDNHIYGTDGACTLCSGVTEYRDQGMTLQQQIVNAEEGAVIEVPAGTYDMPMDKETEVQGQSGWYLAIEQNGVTIKGETDENGNPLTVITSTQFAANGNWATQNLVTIFGDNVTLENVIIEAKLDTNKAIEITGANSQLKNVIIRCNTTMTHEQYLAAKGIEADSETDYWEFYATSYSGMLLYKDNLGDAKLENVTIEKGWLSFSNTYVKSGTLEMTDVTMDYRGCGYAPWYTPFGLNDKVTATNFTVLLDEDFLAAEDADATWEDFMNSLPDGSTVVLEAGTYEVGTLNITKSVDLKGASVNENLRSVADGDVTVLGNLLVNADNVTLSGLNVYAKNGHLLHVAGNNFKMENSVVRRIDVDENTVYGDWASVIYFEATVKQATFLGTTIVSPYHFEASVLNNGGYTSIQFASTETMLVMESSTLATNGYGFFASLGHANFTDVTFRGLYGDETEGVLVETMFMAINCSSMVDVVLDGCTVQDARSWAILAAGESFTVKNSTFTNNKSNQITFAYGKIGKAVIEGNTFNLSAFPCTGEYDAAVSFNWYGKTLEESVAGNLFAYVEDSYVSISDNTFINAAGKKLFRNANDNLTIYALNCTLDCDISQTQKSENVIVYDGEFYVTSVKELMEILALLETIDPMKATVHVVTGDYVLDGTLYINSSVSLVGEGAEATVIIGHIVVNASNVTLKDLSIQVETGRALDVAASGNNFTLDGCDVRRTTVITEEAADNDACRDAYSEYGALVSISAAKVSVFNSTIVSPYHGNENDLDRASLTAVKIWDANADFYMENSTIATNGYAFFSHLGHATFKTVTFCGLGDLEGYTVPEGVGNVTTLYMAINKADMDGVILEGCTIKGTRSYGILAGGTLTVTESTFVNVGGTVIDFGWGNVVNVTITGNTFDLSTGYGMRFYNERYNEASVLTIDNNIFKNLDSNTKLPNRIITNTCARTIYATNCTIENCSPENMNNNNVVINGEVTMNVNDSAGFVAAIHAVNELDLDTVAYIYLAAGTYSPTSENVNDRQFGVTASNVHIIGAGMDETILDAGKITYDKHGFMMGGDHGSICDLTIRTTAAGADALKISQINAVEHIVTDFEIRNVKLDSADGSGLNLHGVDGVTLENINVVNYRKCGVALAMATDVTIVSLTTALQENRGWGDIGFMDDVNSSDPEFYATPCSVTIDFNSCSFGMNAIYSERVSVGNNGEERGANVIYDAVLGALGAENTPEGWSWLPDYAGVGTWILAKNA